MLAGGLAGNEVELKAGSGARSMLASCCTVTAATAIDVVRAGRDLDLKIRKVVTGWQHLASTPLPAIACQGGSFVVLAARRGGREKGGDLPIRVDLERDWIEVEGGGWRSVPAWPWRLRSRQIGAE